MKQPDPACVPRRLAAGLVDVVAALGAIVLAWGVIRYAVVLTIALTGLSADITVTALPFAAAGVALVVPWLYWVGLESLAPRGTIGKALLGIRVQTEDGRLPGLGQASRRYLLRALLFGPLLPVGLIVLAAAALTRERRTLWDVSTGTRVVRDPATATVYELVTSTLIIPPSTRTEKVSTGS